jgi:ferric-dicitrate binding protein FerR (iron transport regulator)
MSDNPRQRDGSEDALASVIRLAGRRPVPSEAARARVYASVRAAWEEGIASQANASRRRPRPSVWWLAAAAALSAIVVALGVLRGPSEVSAAPIASVQGVRGNLWIAQANGLSWRLVAADDRIRAGDSLRTDAGGRAVVDLPDDVSLRIAGDTQLVVRAADRIAIDHGTLYVDSGAERRAEAAVHVVTPVGEVWDVGTQFEVRADAASLRIRVREGEVHFEGGDRALQSGAGEEVTIPARGEAVRARISPTDSAWAWVSDLAALQSGDYPAATLLQWISRETGRELRFDDPATEARAHSLLVHGAQGLSPLETVHVIVATTDLACDIEDSAIVVHSARLESNPAP